MQQKHSIELMELFDTEYESKVEFNQNQQVANMARPSDPADL